MCKYRVRLFKRSCMINDNGNEAESKVDHIDTYSFYIRTNNNKVDYIETGRIVLPICSHEVI